MRILTGISLFLIFVILIQRSNSIVTIHEENFEFLFSDSHQSNISNQLEVPFDYTLFIFFDAGCGACFVYLKEVENKLLPLNLSCKLIFISDSNLSDQADELLKQIKLRTGIYIIGQDIQFQQQPSWQDKVILIDSDNKVVLRQNNFDFNRVLRAMKSSIPQKTWRLKESKN